MITLIKQDYDITVNFKTATTNKDSIRGADSGFMERELKFMKLFLILFILS